MGTIKHDVFISYRRDGGEYTAKILRDRLGELGYAVFFDVESLRSGDFNTKLYSVIEESTDFILVLSPGALDRCQSEDDWVRREVEYALERGKNIIPVMLRGFEFPEKLPPALEQLRFKNGIQANTEFFEAFIQKLESFLQTKPPLWRRVMQNTVFKRTLPVFLTLLLVAVVGMGAYAFLNRAVPVYPGTEAEKSTVNEMLYYIEAELTQLDLMADHAYKALAEAQRYVTSGSVTDTALSNQLDSSQTQILNLVADLSAPSDRLLDQLANSPFNPAELVALHDVVTSCSRGWIDDIDNIRWIVSPNNVLSDSDKLKILDIYQTFLDEDMQINAYCANEALLVITDKSALSDFLYKYLPTLNHIPLVATSWSDSAEALASAQDASWNKQQKALEDLTALTGESSIELAQTRAYLIRQCMAAGMSRDEAEKYVEALLAQDDSDLSEDDLKELRLREAIIQRYMEDYGASRSMAEAAADKLLPKYLELRDKFAPQEGDTADILWPKLAGLMRWQLYDWAEPCVDALEALGDEGDAYAEEYLPTLRTFVQSVDFDTIDYGAMVVAWEGADRVNEAFQIGDIIVTFNGKPCRNVEEYSAARAALSGPDYTVGVLRLNEDGELKLVNLELTTDMPRVGLRSLNSTPIQEEDNDELQS